MMKTKNRQRRNECPRAQNKHLRQSRRYRKACHRENENDRRLHIRKEENPREVSQINLRNEEEICCTNSMKVLMEKRSKKRNRQDRNLSRRANLQRKALHLQERKNLQKALQKEAAVRQKEERHERKGKNF